MSLENLPLLSVANWEHITETVTTALLSWGVTFKRPKHTTNVMPRKNINPEKNHLWVRQLVNTYLCPVLGQTPGLLLSSEVLVSLLPKSRTESP